MEQSHDLLTNDLLITDVSYANLSVAAKWGKFLAITGFILCVIIFVAGIALQTILSGNMIDTYGSGFPKYIGITYMIMSLILFFPALYLLKFSNKMQDALKTNSQESLEHSFISLKSMFKFYGIFTIIMLIFFILAILGVMANTMMK